MGKLYIRIALVTMCTGGTFGQEFTYDMDDNIYGPTMWTGSCQTGTRQSPINLVVSARPRSTQPHP